MNHVCDFISTDYYCFSVFEPSSPAAKVYQVGSVLAISHSPYKGLELVKVLLVKAMVVERNGSTWGAFSVITVIEIPSYQIIVDMS